jgi:hypothetical protein
MLRAAYQYLVEAWSNIRKQTLGTLDLAHVVMIPANLRDLPIFLLVR